MSAMSNKNLEMHEIAEGDSDEAKIKEFGSVKQAEQWLEEQERMADLADSINPEDEPQPDSHNEWRTYQILDDLEKNREDSELF